MKIAFVQVSPASVQSLVPLLTAAGHEVAAVAPWTEASTWAATCDLLVIGESLSAVDRRAQATAWRTAEERRTARSSEALALLWILPSPADLPTDAGGEHPDDELVCGAVSPTELHWRIQHLVARQRQQQVALQQAANEARCSAMREAEQTHRHILEHVQRLELAARGSNDGLWCGAICLTDVWEEKFGEMWFSTRFKQMLGYEEHEFSNHFKEWEIRLHPEDHDGIVAAFRAHVERQVPYDVQYRLLTKNDGYRWFQARGEAVWDRAGRATMVAGSIRDITERKASEQALQESEERYRVLVELSPDAILVHREGQMLYLNPAGAELIQIDRSKDLVGASIFDFVSPERASHVQASIDDLKASPDIPQSSEHQVVRRDGQTVDVDIVAASILFQGEPAMLAIGRDITDRKRAELAVQQEQKLLRKLLDSHERDRRLLAYEIHDGLVQYLAGAVMRLQALTENLPNVNPHSIGDELELCTTLLGTSLREARRLISGLRPPILDESGIISAIEYLINEPKECPLPAIEFVYQLDNERLAPLLESTVFRIVQEALNNARRHSKATDVRVELVQEEDQLRLDIRDNGVGFDPGTVQEERYGLQGIRERARLIGGQWTIDSKPGEGTHIAVRLPMLSAPRCPTIT